MTTVAPSSAKSSAVLRPMPLVPPTTIAILSFNRSISTFLTRATGQTSRMRSGRIER